MGMDKFERLFIHKFSRSKPPKSTFLKQKCVHIADDCCFKMALYKLTFLNE